MNLRQTGSHARPIGGVLFAAAIVALFVSPYLSRARPSGVAAVPLSFRMRETAAAMGIDFRHELASFDPMVRHFDPWLGAMTGASVAVGDVNADGWPDLYFTNGRIGGKNRLYLNHMGRFFEDVTERSGLGDVNLPGTGISTAAAFGDFDGDGREDLLLGKWGHLELYRNLGDARFARVTAEAGLGEWMNASGVTWWDYDGDGCLDIHVSTYFRSEVDLWNLKTTRILMDDIERARNGGANKLYRNRCDGTFQDVSRELGFDDTGWSLAAGAAHLTGGPHPDFYVANDFGRDSLHASTPAGFENVRVPHGIGDDTKKGMSVAFGDFNNSGRLSVYVTNILEPRYLVEGNMLWENLGHGRFRDVAWPSGSADGGWAWGAVFGDFDNDGHLDIFCANGFRSADRGHDYFYEFSTISGTMKFLLEDAATWPPVGTRSMAGHERSRLFRNDGHGAFRDVAAEVGVDDELDGRGVAVADLDRNGSLDVVVANAGDRALVYMNEVDPTRKWIELELRPKRTGGSVLGTRVTLRWKDQIQIQELTGGGGYCAQSERLLHFGLGRDPGDLRAEITWPNGTTQLRSDLRPDTRMVLVEP